MFHDSAIALQMDITPVKWLPVPLGRLPGRHPPPLLVIIRYISASYLMNNNFSQKLQPAGFMGESVRKEIPGALGSTLREPGIDEGHIGGRLLVGREGHEGPTENTSDL